MARHSRPRPPRKGIVIPVAAIVAAAVVGYGWVTNRPGPPAAPAVTQQNSVAVHPPSPPPPPPAPKVTVTVPVPKVTVTVQQPPPVVRTREVVKTVPVPAPRAATRCLPPYPGEAHLGDRGRVARAWQEILIRAGVISDWAVNRDGYFGPAVHADVVALQRSWGWTPIPGYAGPRTYRKLTEVTC